MSDAATLRFEKCGSWVRAISNGIVIRPQSRATQLVELTDSGGKGHEVILVSVPESGQYVGRCDCLGFQHHEKACAHLWAVRIAERHNAVEIPTRDELLESAENCPQCGRRYEETHLGGET